MAPPSEAPAAPVGTGLYGFVCADCPKRLGSGRTLSGARRGCASHSRRCPAHHMFLLRDGLATLEMWGGHDG